MKIIKNNVEEIEYTCKRCQSVFSYNKYDIVTKDNRWFLLSLGFEYKPLIEKSIQCPICRLENKLNEEGE